MAARTSTLANLLRERSGSGDQIPVDVDAIAGWCRLEVAEAPVTGFLGALVSAGKNSGILIREGQYRGQRRFTIAHELGHFAIPTHEGRGLCLERHILRPRSDKAEEREANQFAAELLMPRGLFLRHMGDADPSFRNVKGLAAPDRFDVSVTACALRLVKLSREPAALVCARNGRVEWRFPSPNFYYALPSPGHRLPAETCAAAVFRGEHPSDDPERVAEAAWFMPRGETEEVLESTFAIESLGQVLSLVWAVERE